MTQGEGRQAGIFSILIEVLPLRYHARMEQKRDPGRKSGVIDAIAMEGPEDAQELILGLRCGDRDALAALMDLHGEDLMRYLYALTGDRELAQDVFQDTWVRVMDKAGSFRPTRGFAPWLFRIARNRAIDVLRRRKTLQTRPLEDASGAASVPQVPGDFLERESVQAALAQLPVKHREILGLRYYLDTSYEEMSALLRLPMGTIKSRLKRALEHLSRAFQEEKNHER